MDFEKKIKATFNSISNLILPLKKKLNATSKRKEYDEIVLCIKESLDFLILLSDALKDIDEFKESYTEEEMKMVFSDITKTIKRSRLILTH